MAHRHEQLAAIARRITQIDVTTDVLRGRPATALTTTVIHFIATSQFGQTRNASMTDNPSPLPATIRRL